MVPGRGAAPSREHAAVPRPGNSEGPTGLEAASKGTPAAVAEAAARILAFGHERAAERHEYANIASAIGVQQYVAVAAEVACRIGQGRVLDWGAGWGQTSLLLRVLGLDVVAYDVEDKGAATGLLARTAVAYIVAPGPRLPFDDRAFDAILNCGVLEHVDDEAGALAELYRVLRPGGSLLTYHLPSHGAYTEWLGRRLGRFYHDRTYTRAEAIALFERAGFRVADCRPFHLLPRNIWGRRGGRLAAGVATARAYDALDRTLLRIPGVARLATAWAVDARRPP